MKLFETLRRSILKKSPAPLVPEVILACAETAGAAGVSKALFRELNRLKASRTRHLNVDYFRAKYFAARGQTSSAIESLKEELRYFPDNERARQELLKLHVPDAQVRNGEEFVELLRVVRAFTMVGELRLRSLYAHARELCERDAPGNFVECGVAAGGSSALLAAVINRHSRRPRLHFAFDTFEGMPDPGQFDRHQGQVAQDTGWGAGTCAAPEDSLRTAAGALGALELVRPVKGLFADTLPASRQTIGPIALLHVDGDWYASTMDILTNLYDQVILGGIIQIDDYGYWEGCKRAVKEFEAARGITFAHHKIDGTGVWFAKP